MSASDRTHDAELSALITQAREEWENDTDTVCCTSTWRVKHQNMEAIVKLPKRPIQSVSSITYYDGANNIQTLSTSIYNFDSTKREIRLQYLKVYPVSVYRWDAWTTTYICGYSDDGTSVPAIAKRAMLLLVGYYFEQRGDGDRPTDKRAYEALVNKYMRADYP